MTVAEAIVLRLALITFARGAADVDQWRQDNGRYLNRNGERYPRLHELVEEVAKLIRRPDTR